MAARIRKHHQDEIRAKIQVSNILTRLFKGFLGEVELNQNQLTSARILLDKSMSNDPTEIANTVDGKLEVIHKIT